MENCSVVSFSRKDLEIERPVVGVNEMIAKTLK